MMVKLPDWFPDPKAPPNKMDRLVHGEDCARHPLLGCIIGYGNGDPKEQARNFLRSLRNATVYQVAGRAGDLSDAEFRELWRALEAGEAANTLNRPPPLRGHPFALGRDAEADRRAHMAEQYRIDAERQRIESEQKLRDAKQGEPNG